MPTALQQPAPTTSTATKLSQTLPQTPVPTPQELLKTVFGFDQFREGQAEVVDRLLAGQSVLSVFPTGGGKSLCYQLPALLLDGLTVVISPLIALMKDQIDFLHCHNVCAARLDSTLSREEAVQVYRDVRSGRLRILYVSPERLGNERFLEFMASQNISLLAVDEAHCISHWGHNFRPDYLRIAALADKLRVGRVLALTATATPQVAADIACSFNIEPDDVVQTGFYRPNLELRVTPCCDRDRMQILVDRIRARPLGPTVVYVTLQRTAARVAAFLASCGFSARPYHAGLETEERTEVQDEFMQANDMIVVATIAFGMGIDKSNIRSVYHFNLPNGLESYMQEIGRAGRDGKPAVCEMLACADDVVTLENFSYGDTPTDDAISKMVAEVLSQGDIFDVSVYDLAGRFDIRLLVVKTLLTYLELDGFIELTGPFYSEFKFKPQRSSEEILARFDPQRKEFLQSLFRLSQKGKTWFTLDVQQATLSLRQPRERIVKALDFLEEQGDLVVQVAGVRLGFRRLRQPTDQEELVAGLVERFAQRERADITRVQQIVSLAEHPGCLTDHLLNHFGEEKPECGHCDRCLGEPSGKLPTASYHAPDAQDTDVVTRLVAERHPALRAPRQMARFLCGITSPATSKAKLKQHNDFGRMDRVPFPKVLKLAEQVAASPNQ